MKKYCIECNKEISRRAKRCKFCENLHRRGELSSNWKGGIILRRGYIMIKCYNHPYTNHSGYVFEHRLVMEKSIGRYLRIEERVHHINGIKTDNRIENLRLCKNMGDHSKIHNPFKKRLNLKCKYCGKTIYRLESKTKNINNYFCNFKCQTDYRNIYKDKLGRYIKYV